MNRGQQSSGESEGAVKASVDQLESRLSYMQKWPGPGDSRLLMFPFWKEPCEKFIVIQPPHFIDGETEEETWTRF